MKIKDLIKNQYYVVTWEGNNEGILFRYIHEFGRFSSLSYFINKAERSFKFGPFCSGEPDLNYYDFREATSEEIQHFETCKFLNKYVPPLSLEHKISRLANNLNIIEQFLNKKR